MKNKAKTVAVLLAALLSLSLLAVFTGVSAEDDADPAAEQKNAEQVNESAETGMGVLIHHANGQTEESVFVPDAENPYDADSERVLEDYDPLGLDGRN